jgi:stage V sporulation protein B
VSLDKDSTVHPPVTAAEDVTLAESGVNSPAMDAALSAESKARDVVTRTAGRGGLAVAFAKVYFILQGLVQQVILPRVLGLDGYGALASALSIAGIAYNPVTSTSIQGVSRAVAQAPLAT